MSAGGRGRKPRQTAHSGIKTPGFCSVCSISTPNHGSREGDGSQRWEINFIQSTALLSPLTHFCPADFCELGILSLGRFSYISPIGSGVKARLCVPGSRKGLGCLSLYLRRWSSQAAASRGSPHPRISRHPGGREGCVALNAKYQLLREGWRFPVPEDYVSLYGSSYSKGTTAFQRGCFCIFPERREKEGRDSFKTNCVRKGTSLTTN